MKLSKIIYTATIIATMSQAIAHGETIAGPHGGEIRMPGAFHTEAVTINSHKLKVYLLDANLKHPTVESSQIDVYFIGHHKTKADCIKHKDFFLCSFRKDINLKNSGALEIEPVYKNQKGIKASYKTPLKFSKITHHSQLD